MSQQEALRKMSKLVNYLMAKPDASPFNEPVAWRELELWDYPQIVKKMMDLGTIKRKLLRQGYRNAAECAEDIRLVWSNCMLYNTEGSDFYLLAKALSKRFEERYRKISQEYDVGKLEGDSDDDLKSAGSSSKSASSSVSLDTKGKLAERIFLLSGKELGWVLTKIENECPEALMPIEESPPLHQEVDIDKIPKPVFDEVEKYITSKLMARNSSATPTEEKPRKKQKKG